MGQKRSRSYLLRAGEVTAGIEASTKEQQGTKVGPGRSYAGQSDAGESWQPREAVPSMCAMGGCPLDAQSSKQAATGYREVRQPGALGYLDISTLSYLGRRDYD